MSVRPLGEGQPAPALPDTTTTATATTTTAPPATEASEGPRFATVLHALARESDRGEALMQRALSGFQDGSGLGTAELLALQAGIYRYGHVVDLATKLVDRASTDAKTVLQGQ